MTNAPTDSDGALPSWPPRSVKLHRRLARPLATRSALKARSLVQNGNALLPAHLALEDVGIADQVVDTLGWDNAVGHVIEISIPADKGDSESLAALVLVADAGAVGGHQKRNVRSNHSAFFGEGSDEDSFVRGVALVHFPKLSKLRTEGPVTWVRRDQDDHRLALQG